MTLLSIRNLAVDFQTSQGVSPAVYDMSFDVGQGEVVALVGESGSGKSVCSHAVVQLQKHLGAQVRGAIAFDGTELTGLSDQALRAYRGQEIAYIFQEPGTSLNPLHPVGRQMTERARIVEGMESKTAMEKAVRLLGDAGIRHPEERIGHLPHTFSGGEKQRIMIAMALMGNPKLIVADEPTTALDATLQEQILTLITGVRDRYGTAILLITHDLAVVRSHADRVVVAKGGRIVENAPAGELFAAPKSPYTRMLLNKSHGGPVSGPQTRRPLLELEGVGVTYTRQSRFKKENPVRAVDGVSLTLTEGTTLGVVGESGSGKSTLARAILRLIPSTGSMRFDGEPLSELTGEPLRQLRRSIQVVFQDPHSSFNPKMTVGDIVGEGLRAFSMPGPYIDKTVDRCLTNVGLSPEDKMKYPHQFSGGQKQRIAIARALALSPKLVILDEPTSSLDRNIQFQIVSLLKELQDKLGLSYLFISHDLNVIRAISHDIAVIKEGKLLEYGPADTVFDSPDHPYTQMLMKGITMAA
ncbi:ABC transporter ATP-binding protein [Desulfoluna spongiiphila]|uniref:ABC transporter ATP-binding protein n=1 Tax=Desulfoluna spongiiphila TaxID=419481 RepID=UPI0012532633|nr:dipeptide ABC transporter ATP-binding protein [Desulfoluna spongiiphila]VVS94568.1 abc transporter-like [Desulfoluna spongiiphila]